MLSILRRVAANVTAADLQTDLGPFLRFDETQSDAFMKLMQAEPDNVPFLRALEHIETFCLVGDSEDCPTHYLTGIDLGSMSRRRVRRIAEPIRPRDCVAGDTPALSLATLLVQDERQPWRFVLTQDRISGVVSHLDMAKPEFAIAVLALLLDVERSCLDACSWEPGDAEAAWRALNPNRQAKALDVYALKFKRPPLEAQPEDLITCTTFKDKAKMVAGLPAFGDTSRTTLDHQFQLMEGVRNALAHSSGCRLEELLQAITVGEELLRRLTPVEAPAPIRLAVSNVIPALEPLPRRENDEGESTD